VRPLTVLVIDDEPQIRRVVRHALEADGARVLEAASGRDGLDLAAAERPDLVVLDLGLPDITGLDVCRDLRAWSAVPVLVLSARHSDHEKATLLDAGADDYVTKPLRPLQLAARVRALLRRCRRQGAAPSTAGEPEVLTFDGGNLLVDTARCVAVVHGREVSLSATEYRLLETLARHAGRVLTHDQILEHVWGHAYAGASGYVKTYVGLLRAKVEPDPKRPVYVLARRGLGYYLERRGPAERRADADMAGEPPAIAEPAASTPAIYALPAAV
jgi:two-component system KDP operon response regulator KdpE